MDPLSRELYVFIETKMFPNRRKVALEFIRAFDTLCDGDQPFSQELIGELIRIFGRDAENLIRIFMNYTTTDPNRVNPAMESMLARVFPPNLTLEMIRLLNQSCVIEYTFFSTDFQGTLGGDTYTFSFGSYGPAVVVADLTAFTAFLQGIINPDCGVGVVGSAFTFNVVLPSSLGVPSDWTYELASDPGVPIPIVLTAVGVYTDYVCFGGEIAVADTSQWGAYIVGQATQNEVIPFATYNDPLASTRLTATCAMSISASSTGTVTEQGDGIHVDIVVTHIPNLPGVQCAIQSWDLVGAPETTQLSLIPCL